MKKNKKILQVTPIKMELFDWRNPSSVSFRRDNLGESEIIQTCKKIMEKALKRTKSTQIAKHDLVEKTITQLYKDNKVDMPKDFYFKWVDSPEAAIKYLREHTNASTAEHAYFGSLEHYWPEFLSYFKSNLETLYGPTSNKTISLWQTLSKHGGWWFPYDKLCVCVEKPISVNAKMVYIDNVAKIDFFDSGSDYLIKWKDGTGVPTKKVL